MKHLLETAIEASLLAGKAIMEVYADPDNFQVEIKADHSPLTLADQKSNDIINDYLLTTKIPIISEENRQLDYDSRKDWKQCWIVDPLDGTKEFIKRNGEFTVNIALAEAGQPILGVIYVPANDELYFASSEGAFKLDQASGFTDIDEIVKKADTIQPLEGFTSPVKVVGSRSHLNDDTKKYITDLEKEYEVDIVAKGSSLKFCLVAEGLAHVYPRYAPTMEWDTAAGQAICAAVGVDVLDDTTGEPLKYNKENLLNPYFLVTI